MNQNSNQPQFSLRSSDYHSTTFGSDKKHKAAIQPSNNTIGNKVVRLKDFPDTMRELDLHPQEQNYRIEIEKVRARMEAKIRNLLENYWNEENYLLDKLPNDEERKVIENTRPDILGETGDWSHRRFDYIDSESDEDKNEEIRLLKDRIKSLRRRQDSDNFLQSSLDDYVAHQLAETVQDIQGDSISNNTLQKLADLCKINWEYELQEREIAIRDQLDSQFDQQRRDLRQKYENMLNDQIAQTQSEIQEYWNNQIQQLSSQKPPAIQIDLNKLRQDIYNELSPIYDQQFNKYLEQRQFSNQVSDKYAQIQREMDRRYQLRLEEEQQNWKQEIGQQVLPKLREKVKQEIDEKLDIMENEYKQKASLEIESAVQSIQQVSKETTEQKLLQAKMQKDQLYKKIKEQAKQEIIEQLQKDQRGSQVIEIMKQKIERKLRLSIAGDIRSDLCYEIEKEMKQKAIQEFNKKMQLNLRKERKTQAEMLKVQRDKLSKKFNRDVTNAVHQTVQVRKKDLLKQYKKRLDKEINSFKDSTEETSDLKYSNQIQLIQEEIQELESEKLNLRLQIKQAKHEIQEESRLLEEDKEQLETKYQELTDVSLYSQKQYEIPKVQDRYTPLSQQSTIFNTEFINNLPASQGDYDRIIDQYIHKPILDESPVQKIKINDSPLHTATVELPRTQRAWTDKLRLNTNDSVSPREEETPQRRFLSNKNSNLIAEQLIAKNIEEAKNRVQNMYLNKIH